MTLARRIRQHPLAFWMLVAAVARICAAATHSTWAHLDEWFQTIELGQLLAKGFATYSQEIEAHLRNLTWPFMLSLGVRLSDLLSRDSIWLRIFVFQLITALLDLGMLWGFWETARTMLPRREERSTRMEHLALALVVLPWFTVADSVRASAEHLATVSAWITLGLISRRQWAVAGFMAVAIAAFKYPAGFFSIGFLVWILVWERQAAKQFVLGCIAGLFVFGLPDWFVYGRPWESLWMYIQFNLATDLGERIYGRQSAIVYLEQFSHWGGVLLPISLGLLVPALWGLRRGWRTRSPWVIAPAFYLIAHLFIGHKEKRFMWPIESFLLFAAFVGALELGPRARAWVAAKAPFVRRAFARRALAGLVALCFAANLALFARAMWGESLTLYSTYFEAPSHLRNHPNACGIITARLAISSLLPDGEVPVGNFPAERRRSTFDQASSLPVFWTERAPQCSVDQKILLHVDKPDSGWSSVGCEILASGLLRWLPPTEWDRAIQRGWVSGPWYACPSNIMKRFQDHRVEHPLVHEFGRFSTLPRLGLTTEELVAFMRSYRPGPKCWALCAHGENAW